MKVLFMCTHNSCRSILSEAVFNHLAPEGMEAVSSGSFPSGRVNTRAIQTLKAAGIPTDGLSSKASDAFEGSPPDIVITVCSSAAGETCPAYLGPVLRTHWGVEDPAHATGTDEEIDAAFSTAYRILRARIEAFLALPLADLQQDKAKLKAELDRIGTMLA